MKLVIEQTQNGFILTGKFGETDFISKVVVAEQGDGEYVEIEAMKELLFIVKEYFGIFYSKHNDRNLCINIKDNEDKEINEDGVAI